MLKIKFLNNIALFSALLFGAISASTAQTASTSEIRGIGTGYSQDQFIVYSPALLPLSANPANCSYPDGYGARIDYQGYKTHFSVAQLAFALGKPVTVVVSNTAGDCIDNRPRIISISVYK
jgi:hypothetical protein